MQTSHMHISQCIYLLACEVCGFPATRLLQYTQLGLQLAMFLRSNRRFGSLTFSENQICFKVSHGGKRNCLVFLEKTLSSCSPCYCNLSVPRAQSSPSQWFTSLLQTLNSYLGLFASVLTGGSFAVSDLCYPGAKSACPGSRGCFPLHTVSSYTLNSFSFVS